MEDCEKVTLIEEEPSPRRMSPVIDEISSTTRMTVQGEGSSSHDQSVAIADQHNVLQSVVVERPPPQSQSRIRDAFRNNIMNEGGESGEASGEASDEARGESSNNTRPTHKIQKIPWMLWQRKETQKYYCPQLVSIGPYYSSKFESFQKFKFQFAREYVKSCEPHSIDKLYINVAKVAGEARRCYAEDTRGIEDTAFTEMMFLDGCFILQFMCYIVKDEEDRLEMMMGHDIALVKRDLFLLGNQLPLIVLRALTTMATKPTLFAEKKGFYPKFIKKIRETHHSKTPLPEHEHCNHLLQCMWEDHVNHHYAISSKHLEKEDCGSNRHQYPRHSAMDLKMVGIRFKPSHCDHLSYIAFKSTWTGGILILPKINIDNTTISLLHNLIAYEHCPDSCARYLCVTNYICFLDSIIVSANDVKELKYAGIISNFLGNDGEVVKIIHGMAAGLVPDCRNTRYSEVKLRIKKYHSHKRKTRIAYWISEVIRDHFRSPWTAIAVLAALFALFLTAVQTYFAAFPHTDKCQESICNYLKNNTLQSNGG